MSVLVSLLVTIFILGLLIFVHELGHFLIAKKVGIKVHEFALGMGPIVYSKQAGETLYSLRAFPIGGFNRMAGMEGGEMTEPRGFNTRTVGQRMGVIAAGSLMNFVLAIVLFIILFMGIGVASDSNQIASVIKGGPAEQAGLKAGDRILAVNGTETPTWGELTTIIRSKPNETLQILASRKGETFELTLHSEQDPKENVGMIGIKRLSEKKGFFESIWLGIMSSVATGILIIQQLVLMIGGAIPAEVAGPVGMVQIVGDVMEFGIGSIIHFAAMLSLNLGIINLFPIPALDGSRLIFLGVEGVRGRPIKPERENFFHFIGFVLLIGLMLLITYKDIWRIVAE